MASHDHAKDDDRYLDGKLLIAMPGIGDERFAGTVIYMCAHSSDGAMGIVLNQRNDKVDFIDLLVQLKIIGSSERETLPPLARGMAVRHGGPVETGRGFVLHSADYFLDNSTLPIDDALSLTTTLEVLKAIAEGRGPARAMLALGYAGWAAGQLESEIQYNGWLHCAADPDLVFAEDTDQLYARALGKLGVDLAQLSSSAGHA